MSCTDAAAGYFPDVSRETCVRLDTYAQLLRKWQPRINLIAPKTLPMLWERHFLDSAQLLDCCPVFTGKWVDLGSGGGFPGLVCAILAAEKAPNLHVTLIEADQRKSVFLREVIRRTSIQATVLTERIELAPPQNADVVSARALAPLPSLLPLVYRHLAPDGQALLQKGAGHARELASARPDWQMNVEEITSRTAADSVILRISGLVHARS
jgi:16S rRNA (guanine527-N7)-methyltransferase